MTKPTLWITRSVPAAFKSAEQWALSGCAAAVAPLLKISPPAHMPPLPEKNAVLIFTSGNGIEAFKTLTDKRDWPVITVGDETARLAREAGFKQVSSAKGTSEDVTRLIQDKLPQDKLSKTSAFIHCAGQAVRGAIVEDLSCAGYTARRDIYYQSTPVDALPKIDLGRLNYIALYSPLAAQTLASFKPDLSYTTTLSISAAADAALDGLNVQSRLIAARPNETAMLALLDTGPAG